MSNKTEKKENPLVGAIILAVCGIGLLFMGEGRYLEIAGTFYIPLQIVGGVIGGLAVLSIVLELMSKKNKSDEK